MCTCEENSDFSLFDECPVDKIKKNFFDKNSDKNSQSQVYIKPISIFEDSKKLHDKDAQKEFTGGSVEIFKINANIGYIIKD